MIFSMKEDMENVRELELLQMRKELGNYYSRQYADEYTRIFEGFERKIRELPEEENTPLYAVIKAQITKKVDEDLAKVESQYKKVLDEIFDELTDEEIRNRYVAVFNKEKVEDKYAGGGMSTLLAYILFWAIFILIAKILS